MAAKFYRRRDGGRRALMTALVVALAWGGGLLMFADSIPSTPTDDETTTDAIVVFTGGSGRLEAGLALLSHHRAERLFVSGVFPGVDVQALLGALQQSGAEFEDRITIGRAADTIGNAAETAEWARENNIRSIRLVTSGYHMPRSLLEFHQAMADVRIVPNPVFSENVKQDQWWRFPGTLELIVGEYNKFLLAWARHRMQMVLEFWRSLEKT